MNPGIPLSSSSSSRTVTEPARELPVRGDYDVLVAGGGVAGVAAAVAAARNGARVCLVENAHALGGLATLGLVPIFLPLCDGEGRQVIAGLGEEMLRLSAVDGPGRIPPCWDGPGDIEGRKRQRFLVEFNPASFMIALDELALAAGVKVMFDTRLCDVLIRDGDGAGRRIEAVIVENKSGRSALACRAVVDATGDADVCARAGEPTACLHSNTRSAWFYSWDGSELKLRQMHDAICPAEPGDLMTFDGHDADGVTRMDIEARRMIRQRVLAMRAERHDDAIRPVLIPLLPQFRMTRRLAGPIELDESDDHRWFDDCIGMTGDWRKPGPIFFLPYRCLPAVRTANLLAAGRCISTTRTAWDITRAIPACIVTGQAAGTAAALCAASGAAVASLPVADLQHRLQTQGVLINRNLADR